MGLPVLYLLLALVAGPIFGKIFDKCELAYELESKHGMSRADVKHWVCTAEFESTFNTEAVNKFNWDGSKDYGLFQISDKFWCDTHTGKNVCKVPCTAFLDDDLTDDLECIRRIIKDTEAWKGKGTGLTAWVAYVNRCKPLDLDKYIAECYDGSFPIPPEIITDGEEDNIIPRLPDETSGTAPDDSTTPSSIGSTPPVSPSTSDTPSTPSSVITTPTSAADENEIINSARVPYPSHHELVVPPDIARRGSVAIHVSASRLPQLSSSSQRVANIPEARGKSIYPIVQNPYRLTMLSGNLLHFLHPALRFAYL